MANKRREWLIPFQFTAESAKDAGSKAGKASGKERLRKAVKQREMAYLIAYSLFKQAERKYTAAKAEMESAKKEYLRYRGQYEEKYGESA